MEDNPFADLIPAGAIAPVGDIGKEMQGQILGKLAAGRTMRNELGRVEKLYNKTLKGTGIRKSLSEYLPTQENARFNAAAARLTLLGRQAFRTPGSGADSDKELGILLRAVEPSTTSFDAANEERISGLRGMLDSLEKNYAPLVGQKPQAGINPNDAELDALIAEYQRRRGAK